MIKKFPEALKNSECTAKISFATEMLAVLYPRESQILMLSSRVRFLFGANHLVPFDSQLRKNEVQGGIAVSRISSIPATRTTSSEKLSRKLIQAFGRLEDGADSKTK